MHLTGRRLMSRSILIKWLVRMKLLGEGIRPSPQNYSFRLPPNMHLWPGDNVTLEVGYEFPRGEWLNEDESRLEIALNGTYLASLPVEKRSLAWEAWRFLGNDIRKERATLRIPQEKLYGNNQLSFYFNMAVNMPENGCELGLPDRIETRLYPDSYLDMSDAQYFAALPELSYWLSAGFPLHSGPICPTRRCCLPLNLMPLRLVPRLGSLGAWGPLRDTPVWHWMCARG